MNKTDQELIRIIGPALRGLMAMDTTLPLVEFSEQAHAGALNVCLNGAKTAEMIVAQLKETLGDQAQVVPAVHIKDLGSFIRHPVGKLVGRAAGKVAMVTGAAQGFGLEIAHDLASQGAVVVLADINESGAHGAAQELCEMHGRQRALGLAMNVTDGNSIQAALDKVIKAYGGLDVFISNAGVLKAESVKTQPEKDFNFVTDVNYKGYFLCVQKVAPIMATQHLGHKEYTSDIIQINSKSGLQGSNRNGAYAGSKFGGIGLTQSFAMELVEDGIKVNSICPGNFFDGPLWSNPDNGLFVQYLRTHKVLGAKTIEDVKKAYEAKVPMGRGCTTPDVMKAVYYLMEQQYETGQALPVTGGQVMLH